MLLCLSCLLPLLLTAEAFSTAPSQALTISMPGVATLFTGSQPEAKRRRTQPDLGLRRGIPIETTIQQGKEVSLYIDEIVREPTQRDRYYKDGFPFPNGFWIGFFRNHVKRQWTTSGQMMYLRAFRYVAARSQAGGRGGWGKHCRKMMTPCIRPTAKSMRAPCITAHSQFYLSTLQLTAKSTYLGTSTGAYRGRT